jgi:glycine/sarcosine N-methyltransferase
MEKNTAQKFYDALSSDYDSMINFDSSLLKRTALLNNFIIPGNKAAADLGCGSGLDSIALSHIGYHVTGFDISQSMVNTASANAHRLGVNAEFYSHPIHLIPKQFNNKFSFAVSLGNSLANINRKNLALSFARIYKLLNPGGQLLVQILNYDRILSSKERIVGITEKENTTFIRFYDFEKERTFFNILKIEKGTKINHSLITSEIFPYRMNEFIKIIKGAGFKRVKKYGGLDKSLFDAKRSNDLVITAIR